MVNIGTGAEDQAHAFNITTISGVDKDGVAIERGSLRVCTVVEKDGNRVTVSTPSGPHQWGPTPVIEDINLVDRYCEIRSKVNRRPAEDYEMNLPQIPMIDDVVIFEKW